jgi:hypothetical protein
MSGDESEHAAGELRYVIRKPAWRSEQVTQLLRILDALALVPHWTADGRPRAGQFPHERIDSDRVETRPSNYAVPNLPRNFYRPEYLSSLDKFERRNLEIGKPVDLTLPSHVLRCVTTFHIKEEFSNLFHLSLANRFKHASDPRRPPLPRGSAQGYYTTNSYDTEPRGGMYAPSNSGTGQAPQVSIGPTNERQRTRGLRIKHRRT